MRGTVSEVFRGARYALWGVGAVLTRPRLWPLLAAPVLVSAVLFVMGAFGAWALVDRLVEGLFAPAPDAAAWITALWQLVELILWVWALVVLGVALYFTSNLVATPFNDWLSQRIETLRLGPHEEPFSLGVVLGDLAQSLGHSILSLMLWAVVLGASALLHLIPGFGSVAAFVIDVSATALFIARESMDGAQSRRRMSFGHKLRVMRRLWPLYLGFGLVGSVFVWIPLVNLLVVPLSIAGGTLLYCDLEREGRVPDASGAPGFRPPWRRDVSGADPSLASG